jgi:hypothetical protein
MKSLKALFAAVVVTAAALSTTGCSGQRAYMEVNPVSNVHGS